MRGGADLPVLLPYRAPEGPGPLMPRLFSPGVAALLALSLAAAVLLGEARAQGETGTGPAGVIDTLAKWTPLMLLGPPGELGGFLLNIVVSFCAMAVGTASGFLLGMGQISTLRAVRAACWAVTQLFRNSPWLVVLFYVMLMVPFRVEILGESYLFPPWVKATMALSLPIMANVSEIVRGAVASIPTAQWESADSLAFSRWQTLTMIILPQCVKRMIPPWMNWYAILTMSTPLISILGVSDGMRLTQDALAAEGRSEYLIPMYLWLMSWFFLYCYPIARLTVALERRWVVKL
jgi:polar amino acid transport system permease protein